MLAKISFAVSLRFHLAMLGAATQFDCGYAFAQNDRDTLKDDKAKGCFVKFLRNFLCDKKRAEVQTDFCSICVFS